MGVYQHNRLPYFLAAFGALLLIATVFHQIDGVPTSWVPSFRRPKMESSSSYDSSQRSFYDIALSHGTDKVTTHYYHHMYQKYLEPYRQKPLKLLEIGLGCDMSYGPGASFYTWLEYLEFVDLYFIESDVDCAEKWANDTTGATIFSGDQADIPFLKRFMKQAGTDFDVIIDDGGHTMNQQITSLENLWRAVKPGGIYVIEDLQTSFWASHGGDPSNSGKINTTMGMVKELIDDLHTPTGGHARKHEVSVEMAFIDCAEEICAIGKKTA